MGSDEADIAADTKQERRILWQVLLLNVLLSVSLAAAGVFADSSGLLANALDNGSDAVVYALSLVAVGRSRQWKLAAAMASGVLLMLFGIGVLLDAVRRVVFGSEPIGTTMIWMSVVAAIVNMACLWLLRPLRAKNVNMRAAQTFSVNDFVSNLGILFAGALIALTGQLWPDIAVGIAVSGIAIKGGIDILRDARSTQATDA